MNQAVEFRGDTRGDTRGGVRLYDLLRPMIFRMAPETAHHVTLALLRAGGAVAPARWLLPAPSARRRLARAVQAFGLTFANPVGLAAGYDKDGLGLARPGGRWASATSRSAP